ncbi:MAG: response regulator transcription factor [Caldilinea sp.]|nr:response regulator transcription factor [Caldilinea sp.]MCB0053078.1 response regulator transcription factor [Caldilinea sp.]MCB0148121.1 response regulator transcription factor [Caldilineaceae bacterium]MCB0187219.1 response regulator transcription factor [Caldilineaceae bacterium]MCW5843254.1 response regulator transcription factor [Caldilinea sp.]
MNQSTLSPKLRILIADDHALIRQGMAVVIGAQPDMILVGAAENGEQAVRMARELQPDVIALDIKMPVKNGIAAIEEIVAANPAARILVITSFPDDDTVFDAIRAGATGYYLKDSSPDDMVNALRTVAAGEAALQPVIARKIMQQLRQPEQSGGAVHQDLTAREIEVLRWLTRGITNDEIAIELGVSSRTVGTHIRNILDKLHLTNRTQAALYAVEQGITAPENEHSVERDDKRRPG